MNWLSIERKRQIGFQFKERVNQPPLIIHPTSLFKKNEHFSQHPTPSHFIVFFEKQRLGEKWGEVDWLFLQILRQIASFF